MCGIIGYIGKKQTGPLLLEGLRRLEYRGYDSSGVSIANDNNKITTVKAVGKIDVLANLLEKKMPKGNWGIGHCLHPKTVVQLASGRTTYIKDVKDGEKVINLNDKNFTLVANLVRLSKHSAPNYFYRVRLSLSDFVATKNHKTLVYDSGTLKEKKVSELIKGNLLPLPRRINIVNPKSIFFNPISYKRYYSLNETGFNFLKQKILSKTKTVIARHTNVSLPYLSHIMQNDRNFREDHLKQLYNFFGENFDNALGIHLKPIDTIHGKFIRLPDISSPRLMQILGYFIGDGYAGEKSLRFKDLDEETLALYKLFIKEEFYLNGDGRIASMNDTRAKLLEINSFYLCQWFRKNIVENKHEFISQIGRLPTDQLAVFVRGLFDAEGFIGLIARQLAINMTDEFIIRSLQLWLLQFGIISSIRIEKPNMRYKRKNFSYRLSISNKESLNLFQQYIGFSNKNKAAKLEVLIQRVGNRRFSFKIIDNYKDIILSRVLSIEKVASNTDFVYDLEVSNHHNFLANGIFTHNSRWATHGAVSEKNAHPHFDCRKNIFLVHNGIIENYRQLKEKLIKEGHKFVSETDTEVLAHLIEKFTPSIKDSGKSQLNSLRQALEGAVIKALKLVKGTYGLAIISRNDPQKIVIARNSSPILIGVGDEEYFVASDASAILAHTKKVIYLQDGEIAVITLKGINFTNLARERLLKKTEVLEWNLEQAQKSSYSHFMLKEIFEQPETIRNAIRGRLIKDEGLAKLGGLEQVKDKLKKIKRIIIISCGTSYYAGLIGEYMIEEYAGIPTEVEYASEFRYRKPIIDKGTAVIVISQSGETADSLAALREAKMKGALTLGIVNVVGSSIARETEAGVYNHAGPEIGVASTKSFTSQLVILALLTLFLGRARQMSLVTGKRIAEEILLLPEKVQSILDQTDKIKTLAKKYQDFKNFLYLGRKYNFPIALEGALKLKEISYLHAEGYAAGEMKHGPIALIDQNFATVSLAIQDSVYEKVLSNLEEIKARSGQILAVTTSGNQEIKKYTQDVIYIPKTLEILTPILSVVPLQLLAYYIAVNRGCDVDKPRNLAKSVTVE